MFRESLLESSPAARGKKRWPMATAFIAELLVAAVLVLIPLFSSGIIPLSARAPQPPLRVTPVAEHSSDQSNTGNSGGPHAQSAEVHALVPQENAIHFKTDAISEASADNTPDYRIGGSCTGNCLPDGLPDIGVSTQRPTVAPPIRVRVSSLAQAQIINRVEPVYPRPATLIHLQGVVQLHALIAKDGTIQSLTVISGHPLLAAAALDAVRQWRYRPYLLNNEPVEVETFITVTFKRTGE